MARPQMDQITEFIAAAEYANASQVFWYLLLKLLLRPPPRTPTETGHRMDKPVVGVATKAQIVDHYAQILTKVMGNEKDVQMCIYHVSWKTNNWLCVPGVLSVQPDNNFEFQNKDYEEFSFGDSWEERRSKPLSDFDPNFTMYSRKWLRYLKYLTKKYLKKHNIQIQIWELQCFSITGGVSGEGSNNKQETFEIDGCRRIRVGAIDSRVLSKASFSTRRYI
ncbi:organelle RRM domain-containing protein 1, chloroplastic [Trifolium repens]|nr:organelle RRM domain-containing protein 1, chloroplastic [Trifolium repens]